MAEFAEGVYFGMPDEEYLAIPALSSSGIKNLRISPLDFWANSRWLNPAYEEDTESNGDNFAKDLGKAYHKRIVEGKDAFAQCYAPEINAADYENILRTVDDMKGWLVDKGLPKTGKTKAELIDRILEHDPTARIWDAIEDGYRKEHEGKSFLPQKYMDKIELAAAMIEKHPELSKAFSGGMPEVTVCWICPDTGAHCKARFDYLKSRAIVDLKTLANKNGLPLRNAVAREIGFRRYHIQAAWYLEAASHIKRLLIKGDHTNASYDFLKGLMQDHPKTFLWVFQMKGVAPAALGYTLPEQSTLMSLARAETDNAKHLYQECLKTFGTDPWINTSKIEPLDDADVPPWALI